MLKEELSMNLLKFILASPAQGSLPFDSSRNRKMTLCLLPENIFIGVADNLCHYCYTYHTNTLLQWAVSYINGICGRIGY